MSVSSLLLPFLSRYHVWWVFPPWSQMAMITFGQIIFLPSSHSELASVSLSLFYQSQDLSHVLRMREEPQADVENEGWGEGYVPM